MDLHISSGCIFMNDANPHWYTRSRSPRSCYIC